MSDFFDESNKEEKQEVQDEKIRLGDDEYTQDELKKLVGLGKIGLEAEEKFKTPIDKVWPNYQRVINENQEFKRQQEEAKQRELQTKLDQGQQLSSEELKEQAKKQARELGLMDMETFESKFREEYAKAAAVNQLLTDTGVAIEKYKNDYNVSTNVDDVLKYMDENGLKNPDKAIKLMFEDTIDQVKEQKIKSIKPQGMVTNSSSQAGGKQPQQPSAPRNEDELAKQLHEFIQSE